MSNRLRTVPLDLPNAAWFGRQRHHSEDKNTRNVPELINSIAIKAAVELGQAGRLSKRRPAWGRGRRGELGVTVGLESDWV